MLRLSQTLVASTEVTTGATTATPQDWRRAVIAGLAVAVILDWLTCPVPRFPRLSSNELLTRAIAYVAVTLIAGVLAAIFAQHGRYRSPIIAVGVGAIAVWCAPLMVFIEAGSRWAALPLIVLVGRATACLQFQRPVSIAAAESKELFVEANIELLRQLPSSLSVAFCLQAAVIAGLLQHSLVAAGALAVGTALLSSNATAAGFFRRRNTFPRAAMRIALATMLTIFGMLPYLERPHLATNDEAGNSKTGGNSGSDTQSNNGRGDVALASSYRGVILWPEAKQHVTLVPPLPMMGHNPLQSNPNPLNIPFYGAYWFFRPPLTRPPDNSVEMHGSPAELTFHSQDILPIMMEAHQNLGTLIDLSCCSWIKIVIDNRDRYAGAVSIELILVNTTIPEKPFQSLGSGRVTSSPGFTSSKAIVAVSETLSYPIPETPAFRQFDEFTIRFPRVPVRAHQSANIAIERFVLVPRTL